MDGAEVLVKLAATAIRVLGVAVAAPLTGNWLASVSDAHVRDALPLLALHAELRIHIVGVPDVALGGNTNAFNTP
jgi:hypothetical protein